MPGAAVRLEAATRTLPVEAIGAAMLDAVETRR
jgi:chemotaxis response regulator CheB